MTDSRNMILCPGQGAQAVGMGKAWAEASPAAKAIFDEADAVLGESLGTMFSAILCPQPERCWSGFRPVAFATPSWMKLKAAPPRPNYR